MRFQWKFFT